MLSCSNTGDSHITIVYKLTHVIYKNKKQNKKCKIMLILFFEVLIWIITPKRINNLRIEGFCNIITVAVSYCAPE